MSVRVELCGRLGNNLFQYAIGRIVSERLGLSFVCLRGGRGMSESGGRSALLEDVCGEFADVPLQIGGIEGESPLLRFEVGVCGWRGHEVDLDRILSLPTKPRLELAGYFQRYRYFAAKRDAISRWFQVEAEHRLALDAEDVVVCLRRGADFARLGWKLPASYYATAFERLGGGRRVIVCSDVVDEEMRAFLARFDGVCYCDETPVRQLAVMMACRRLVLANSTFAWWGAFLASHDHVIAPKTRIPTKFAFSGYRDVELRIPVAEYEEVDIDWEAG